MKDYYIILFFISIILLYLYLENKDISNFTNRCSMKYITDKNHINKLLKALSFMNKTFNKNNIWYIIIAGIIIRCSKTS